MDIGEELQKILIKLKLHGGREFLIGLPSAFMLWPYIEHPDIEIPIEILLFPCHAILHLLLLGPMFY